MPKLTKVQQKILHSGIFLLNLVAASASIATLLGFAGNLWWVFEMLDHPRPQYCLILLSAIVVGGINRQAWSFLWCLPLVLNLAVILPLFFTFAPSANLNASADPASGETLRIIHANLDRDNQETNRAIEYLEAQDVDVVFVQELTPEWLNELKSTLKRYQVVTAEPRKNSHGSALLLATTPSKPVTVVATQIINLPSYSDRPLLEATLQWANRKIVILSLHIIRPQNPGSSKFQQVEFDAVAEWSQHQLKQNTDVVVIGDFNSTPWSGRFRKLLHDSQLRNSLRGFGLQPTWPAYLAFPLRIAIDHCLHSQSLKTINRATGANIGSDHLPLFVELQ